MFEVGFQELFLLGAIALLVVGPERLPGLARTVGLWVGKARRMVAQVQRDVERELRADELRETMKESSLMEPLASIRDEVKDFTKDLSSSVEDAPDATRTEKKPEMETAGADPTGAGVRLNGDGAAQPEPAASTRAESEPLPAADAHQPATVVDPAPPKEDPNEAKPDLAPEKSTRPAVATEMTEAPADSPATGPDSAPEEELRDERAAASS